MRGSRSQLGSSAAFDALRGSSQTALLQRMAAVAGSAEVSMSSLQLAINMPEPSPVSHAMEATSVRPASDPASFALML